MPFPHSHSENSKMRKLFDSSAHSQRVVYTQRNRPFGGVTEKEIKYCRLWTHAVCIYTRYARFTQAANTCRSIHRRAHTTAKNSFHFGCATAMPESLLFVFVVEYTNTRAHIHPTPRHRRAQTPTHTHTHNRKRIKCAPAKIIEKQDSNVQHHRTSGKCALHYCF